jgi:HK97 gp10 family phage protein
MAEFVKIEGLKELEANLKILREQFGVRTGGVIIRGLRAGAKIIRDDAKRRVTNVPSRYMNIKDEAAAFRNGRLITRGRNKGKRRGLQSPEQMLRSNIVEHAIATSSPRAAGRPTVLVRVRAHGYTRFGGVLRFRRPGSSPGWWWWVEFGTSKTPARPFLRPAFEAQKIAAVEEFKKAAKAEIDKLFAKNFKVAA